MIGFRSIPRRFLAALVLLALPAHAQEPELEPVPFSELPVVTQRMFVNRASDFLWIDSVLWSIEVKNRFENLREKFNTPEILAPYQDPGAPMYYDPVNRRSANSEQSALLAMPGVAILRGQVSREIPEGLLVRLPDDQGRYSSRSDLVLLAGVTRREIDPRAVRLAVRRTGTHGLTTGGKTAEIALYEPARKWIRPAEPADIYDYFVRHGLVGFPFLVPRPAAMPSNGQIQQIFTWDDQPLRMNLPPMRRPRSPQSPLQILDSLP